MRNYCRREWLRLGGLRGTMVVITNLISTVWPRSASSNRNFYHCWATSLWNRTEILIMSIDRRSPHTYQWQSVCSISTKLEHIMKQRLGRSWGTLSMTKLVKLFTPNGVMTLLCFMKMRILCSLFVLFQLVYFILCSISELWFTANFTKKNMVILKNYFFWKMSLKFWNYWDRRDLHPSKFRGFIGLHLSETQP